MKTCTVREVALSYRREATMPEAIRSHENVASFFRETVGNDTREHMVAIYLDGRHRPIAWQIVSVGTANASLVHPREVFQPAIHVGAVSLILAHNHPSGDPTPSEDDVTLTRRLSDAAKLLGIGLLDHVVVADSSAYSLREKRPELFQS